MNSGTICEVDGEKWVPGWTTVEEVVASFNNSLTIPMSNEVLATPRARPVSNCNQNQGLGIGRGARHQKHTLTLEERDTMVKNDIRSIKSTDYSNETIENFVQNTYSSDINTSLSDSLSDSDDEIGFVPKKRISTPAGVSSENSDVSKDWLEHIEYLNGHQNHFPTTDKDSKPYILSGQIDHMTLDDKKPFENGEIESTDNQDKIAPKVFRKPRIRNILIDGLLAQKPELISPNYFLNSVGVSAESQESPLRYAAVVSLPTSSATKELHTTPPLHNSEPIYYTPCKTSDAPFSINNNEFPPLS